MTVPPQDLFHLCTLLRPPTFKADERQRLKGLGADVVKLKNKRRAITGVTMPALPRLGEVPAPEKGDVDQLLARMLVKGCQRHLYQNMVRRTGASKDWNDAAISQLLPDLTTLFVMARITPEEAEAVGHETMRDTFLSFLDSDKVGVRPSFILISGGSNSCVLGLLPQS